MDKPNYYEVLQVQHNASMECIKKAYKQLALLYHPDKCGGNDVKFKEIQEAYQILSNTEKRFLYDFSMGDQDAVNIQVYEKLLNAFFVLVMDIMKKQKEKQVLTSVKDVTIDLEVSLDEVYRGDIKKLMVKVKKKDGSDAQRVIYVKLLDHQPKLVFKEQGDEAASGKCSDVIVNIIVKEHPEVKQDHLICKYDLYIEHNVSLHEFYFGVDVEIPFLDDTKLHIKKTFQNHSGGLNIGTSVIKEYGLPYMENNQLMVGDLYIFFRLSLPDPKDVIKTPELEHAIKNLF